MKQDHILFILNYVLVKLIYLLIHYKDLILPEKNLEICKVFIALGGPACAELIAREDCFRSK